jgi:hypothetical protein
MAILGAILLVGTVVASAAAQDLPACDGERSYDCRLPDWSDSAAVDIASPFGDVDGLVWVADTEGDVPPGGLDISGVGLGRVDIDDPAPIRESDDLLKLGTRKKAVPGGAGVLVRIVLDRPPDEVDGGHSSVHLATDIDASRSNNAPTGIADPNSPFAGSQDIYTLAWASTTGKTSLLASDLAKGWYRGKAPFAATWVAPNVLDLLVGPEAFGQDFRVITHVAGDAGGYDSVTVGPASIPADGRVGLVPTCIEGYISAEPFVVADLIENGQALQDVEAPASWRGGASLPIDGPTRAALESLIAERDGDGDGRIDMAATVSLFEDGLVIRQRPALQLALDDDRAQLAVEVGLTRRGYNVLRDFELEPSGDELVDAWLERATDAFTTTVPPFRSTNKAGLVAGEGSGSCIPWLAVEPGPGPDLAPVADAVGSPRPRADSPAASG